jgi:hypothetical protein
MLSLKPITFKDACIFVNENHLHLKAPQGYKFAISAAIDDDIVCVIMIGRPLNRNLDDGSTLEILRLAGKFINNSSSFLVAAGLKVCKNLGYKRLITYIRADEKGHVYKMMGFAAAPKTIGRIWHKNNTLPFPDLIDKICYVKNL